MGLDRTDGAVFGIWLYHRRRQLELTQVELATRVGCSVATIRKLESDQRHASERTARAIAAALGIADEELEAFVRFARVGWVDAAPDSGAPAPDRPWTSVRRGNAMDRRAAGTPFPGLRPRLPEATLRPPRLVAREALWAEMERAWAAGRNITLRGPGGVGKTRLMQDFANSKGPALRGAGNPGDHVLPFGTNRRAFGQFFEAVPAALGEVPPWVRAEVSRFLPELYPDPPTPVKDEAERLRFFEAVLHLTLVFDRHIAMFVADDLQYFDRSSFEVQAWVTSEAVRRELSPARSVAAYRPAEMPSEYQNVVDLMVRGGVSTLLDVDPLPERGVAELLTVLEVPAGSLEAAEVATLTGGNPLLVLEAVKGWWETRELRGTGAGGGNLAQNAARSIRGRFERLEAGDRWIAQAIAVLQEAATPELLAAVVGESSRATAERLARLERQNMIRDAQFVHDLLAEGASACLSAPQRRLLHARTAQALIDRGGEPALVAHHLEGAGRLNEGLAWRLDAAERALDQGSRIEARSWLARVQEIAPEGSAEAARASVLLGAALLGVEVETAHESFTRGLEHARSVVSPALEARALTGLAQTEALEGEDAQARLRARTASEIAKALPPRERARILLDLSEVRWSIGDFGESEEHISEAIRLDPSQPRFRLTLARHHWHRGRYEAAIDELMAVLQADPGSARVTSVLHDLGQNYRALGLLEPALHWLERALEVWCDSGDLLTEARVRETLGITHTSRGALAHAERELVTAAALYRRHGAHARLASVAPKRAYVRLLAGDPHAAHAMCSREPGARRTESNPYRRSERLAVLGAALAQMGLTEEAWTSTRAAHELADASRHPFARVTALRFLAEVATVRGDRSVTRDAAATLLDLTRRYHMREHEAWARCLLACGVEQEAGREHARMAQRMAVEHGFLPVEMRAAERLAQFGEPEMGARAEALRARLNDPPLGAPA